MPPSADAPVLRAKIAGMDCGSCAGTIEAGLRKLPGVRTAAVDFTTESLEVVGEVSREQIEQRLRQLGYRLESSDSATPRSGPRGGFLNFFWSQPQQRLAVIATAALLTALLVSQFAPASDSFAWANWMEVAAVLIVGAPIFRKGLRALFFSRKVTIDLLMTIAAVGAVLIGETSEAATVILLFTFGEGLEGFSASRARDSLRSLMALQPQTATRLRRAGGTTAACGLEGQHDDAHDHHDHAGHSHAAHEGHHHSGHNHADQDHGDHKEHAAGQTTVAAADLEPGDVILVRPGERIAADGVIRSGSSSINQAAVTGESIPVTRCAGETVMAGTINAEGALEVEVTSRSQDSTVARIARLVEQAQAQRSPAERFIDRFANLYTPAVVALAVLTVIVPVYVFGQPLLDTPGEAASHGWLYRGLALLIVACPCALVISIPVTVVSALTRLARMGVLVKGGEQLDRLSDIRTIAFDKTGTLTMGRPSVTAVQALDCAHEPEEQPKCDDCDNVIALAACVEGGSEHPIAFAILQSAQARGLQSRYPAAVSITAISGGGVVGDFRGHRLAVGTDALLGEQGARANLAQFNTLRQSNRTVMTVALGTEVVGAIGVEDPLRTESRSALDELRTSDPPIRTVMLTGDNQRVAEHVAGRIAVSEVRAGLLPADKLAAIRQLQSDYGPVAMVGDGINDAPALASADVGIAMGGSGTAQAMETADVVLLQDDLRRVPAALRIARRSRALIKQNIALSLGLKLAFLALIIPGWATLWLAVVADVGATLLVTLNGMRMLREE